MNELHFYNGMKSPDEIFNNFVAPYVKEELNKPKKKKRGRPKKK